MYKIGICEDDNVELALLEKVIKGYLDQGNYEYTIDSYSNPVVFQEAFYEGKYDLIFLDIYLGRRTGMEVARFIRKKDNDAMIVFNTTSDEFAVESYEVKAKGYMLKPLNAGKVIDMLNECIKNAVKPTSSLMIKVSGKQTSIPINKIEYLESDAHLVYIYTELGQFTVRETLNAIEERLDENIFVRTKQSFLVNMMFIKEIEGGKITLQSGAVVAIKHANIKKIKNKYLKFMLPQMY